MNFDERHNVLDNIMLRIFGFIYWIFVPFVLSIVVSFYFLQLFYDDAYDTILAVVGFVFGLLVSTWAICCLISRDLAFKCCCCVGVSLFIGLFFSLWVLLIIGSANLSEENTEEEDSTILLAWSTVILYTLTPIATIALCIIANLYVHVYQLLTSKTVETLLENGLLDDVMDLELFGLKLEKWDQHLFRISNAVTGNSAWR